MSVNFTYFFQLLPSRLAESNALVPCLNHRISITIKRQAMESQYVAKPYSVQSQVSTIKKESLHFGIISIFRSYMLWKSDKAPREA